MTKDEEIRMINEKLDFLCNGDLPVSVSVDFF